MKLKLKCYQTIRDGLNTKSEQPFEFSTNNILYLTNGYYLNGYNKNKLNEWKECEITNAEWFKSKFYIYINNNNKIAYSGNFFKSLFLWFHYIIKYKLINTLSVIGGVYAIIDIIYLIFNK